MFCNILLCLEDLQLPSRQNLTWYVVTNYKNISVLRTFICCYMDNFHITVDVDEKSVIKFFKKLAENSNILTKMAHRSSDIGDGS